MSDLTMATDTIHRTFPRVVVNGMNDLGVTMAAALLSNGTAHRTGANRLGMPAGRESPGMPEPILRLGVVFGQKACGVWQSLQVATADDWT
jgi:hypothetical protein